MLGFVYAVLKHLYYLWVVNLYLIGHPESFLPHFGNILTQNNEILYDTEQLGLLDQKPDRIEQVTLFQSIWDI